MDKPLKIDKKEKDYCLNEFKEKYKFFEKKYNLPSFDDLNRVFEIEEIDFYETDFLIRKIRKHISLKLYDYTKFIEVFINPANASPFFFGLIKKIKKSDMELINNLYKELEILEIEIIILDLEYNEKNEADLIKKIYSFFNEKLKKDVMNILKKLINSETETTKDINGSYFG